MEVADSGSASASEDERHTFEGEREKANTLILVMLINEHAVLDEGGGSLNTDSCPYGPY